MTAADKLREKASLIRTVALANLREDERSAMQYADALDLLADAWEALHGRSHEWGERGWHAGFVTAPDHCTSCQLIQRIEQYADGRTA